MKTNLTTELYCSAFGHNYFRLDKANHEHADYICKCCKKQFVSNAEGDIIDISSKLNEIQSILKYLEHKKRLTSGFNFSS